MNEKHTVTDAIETFSKRQLGAIKVMLIEDDPVITSLVMSMLSREGCVPYSTLSSIEALRLAEEFLPSVIILDLMMPNLSGEELLVQLKSHTALQTIPVVVFTNKGDSKDMAHVLGLGASAYLVKASTDLPKLIGVVKALAKDPVVD